MPYVWLGNTAPLQNGLPVAGLDQSVTFANVPDSDTPDEQLKAITARVVDGDHMDGVHATHSAAEKPAWVDSSDRDFAHVLADHYGCPVGRPDNWEH